jgi:hypothetical protein
MMRLLITTLLSLTLLGFASLTPASASSIESSETMISSPAHMSQHAGQQGCCSQQSLRCSSVCTSLFATALLPVKLLISFVDVPSFLASEPKTLSGHYLISVPPPR